MDDLPQQSRPERVDLRARVAQPGHLDDSRRADPQPGAAGQPQQIDVLGREVLTELARTDLRSLSEQLVGQLGLQEVDLAEIGLEGSATTRERCCTVTPA
jgi:hypothetical protein